MAFPAVAQAPVLAVLLVATVCHLPHRAFALSPEETADLRGLCDLNPGATGRARRLCQALDSGQGPCSANRGTGMFIIGCDANGHLTDL